MTIILPIWTAIYFTDTKIHNIHHTIQRLNLIQAIAKQGSVASFFDGLNKNSQKNYKFEFSHANKSR